MYFIREVDWSSSFLDATVALVDASISSSVLFLLAWDCVILFKGGDCCSFFTTSVLIWT